MTNGSNGAIESPTTTKPARGAIATLAAGADLTLGVTDEARRLLAIAETQGMTTTIASIKQAIQLRKRKASSTPRKIKHRTNMMVGRVLEDAVESIEALRLYVAALETSNADLKSKLVQVQGILKR